MSLWAKICGNTSLAELLLAAEDGADAAGFIFAPSPRRFTVWQVAEITPRLPAHPRSAPIPASPPQAFRN